MKKLMAILFLITITTVAMAQNRTISGSLFDSTQKETIPYGVVQLLKSDSTYVSGATSDDQGKFSIVAPSDGRYIVKASYVGYKTVYKSANVVNGTDVNVGQISFQNASHTLKEVVVAAHPPKVVLKEDTFQYNASAYRVPEGSTVEALVKKLPGAELSDDGTIKINGKEVKKILVNGKEFMVGEHQDGS